MAKSASTPKKLTVGQRLWYVRKDHRSQDTGVEVEVLSVGRLYATLSGRWGRIHIDTMIVHGEGFTSPGRCYLSRENHEEYRRVRALWFELHHAMNTYPFHDGPPIGTREEMVRGAARLLKIELETEPGE